MPTCSCLQASGGPSALILYMNEARLVCMCELIHVTHHCFFNQKGPVDRGLHTRFQHGTHEVLYKPFISLCKK